MEKNGNLFLENTAQYKRTKEGHRLPVFASAMSQPGLLGNNVIVSSPEIQSFILLEAQSIAGLGLAI